MLKGDKLIEQYPWLDEVVLDPMNLEEAMPEDVRVVLEQVVNQWSTKLKVELFNDIANQYGHELVLAALNMITQSNCRRGWISHREKADKHDYQTFYNILWKNLPNEGFEFTSEHRAGKVCFNVTKCPIADLAKELGIEQWLYPLTCGTDPIAIASFNPQIGFERDKTLMEGFSYCNHTYILNE